VKEEANLCVRKVFPYKLWKQHELVIVDLDVIVRLDDFQHVFTKDVIHLLVGLPVLVFVCCIQREIVEKRPNRFVTKAVIEIFHISSSKKNWLAIVFF